MPVLGALAQRESACSTRKRSLVQSQYAPPEKRPWRQGLFSFRPGGDGQPAECRTVRELSAARLGTPDVRGHGGRRSLVVKLLEAPCQPRLEAFKEVAVVVAGRPGTGVTNEPLHPVVLPGPLADQKSRAGVA